MEGRLNLEEIRAQFPLGWQFDFDLASLHQGEDGIPYVVHRGGIKVPVAVRDGFVTLDPPPEVLAELRRCFPDHAERVIPTLHYSFGHWGFNLHGMYVGIDLMNDGSVYIHS